MDIASDKMSLVPRWRTIILIVSCYLLQGTPGQIDAFECPGRLSSVTLTSKTKTSLDRNAAWMKDPYEVSDRLFYMGYEQYVTRHLYEYENMQGMKNGENAKSFYQTPVSVEGTGFVVLDRNLLFTPERTRKIARFDLSKHKIEKEIEIPAANYDGTSPYAVELATDIDLAIDEKGVWAIYATEYNQGNIVISRFKHRELEILKTSQTDYYKLSALNAFMVCGVLYTVNYETLSIDYMFDTESNIGSKINIPIPGLTRNTSTINYNPKDRMLYVWDDGNAITYQLNFAPITTTTRSTTTTTTTTTTLRVTSTLGPTVSTLRPFPVSTVSPFPYKCRGQEAMGLRWPDTKYRGVAQLNCPGSRSGYAHWICGGNVTHPQWTTVDPDFSQCTSMWIIEIARQLESGRANAVKLSQRFAELLSLQVENKQEIKSWDIVTSIELLNDLLEQSTSKSDSAATLTGSVLRIASLLLDPYTEPAWNALGFEMQNKLASDLVKIVDDAAFFLAYDLSTSVEQPGEDSPPRTSQNKLNWTEKMVSLGITVDPLLGPDSLHISDVTYGNIFWSTGHGDSVKVQTNAIVDSLAGYDPTTVVEVGERENLTTTRHLAIVLLSFKNLGQYMKDSSLNQEFPQPVNSKILSVSAASIKQATITDTSSVGEPKVSVFVNQLQTLNLAKPLRMTIAHERSDLAHNVCAFWDHSQGSETGHWSRRGCRRVDGNSTHSICECDHMTSFTVLSSNKPFPLMGYEEQSEETPTPIVTPFTYIARDLPILRAGLGISLFFLVIVAVTLFALSITRHLQSDINTIHKNLILALIVTEVVFLFGIDRTMVPNVCGAVAALLHFGLLATFTWAALESYHLMAVLGDITERRDRWRWYYAIGYGLPTIVVAASAAVDHEGYGSVQFCWLETDGNFIWSFIGPCCFVIICCILFLGMTVYRLHLYSVNFADAPKDKSIRSGVARSCVLMFLLCALWSCGVLWLSNFEPRLTAILFCTFSSLYGIASFFLYCILPTKVRRCYTDCLFRFSKSSSQGMSRGRHVSGTSEAGRLGSSNMHVGTLPHDAHSTYGGYYTTATGCTTTLLPVTQAQNGRLTKSAVMNQSTATGMNSTMMSSLTNLQCTGQQTRQRGHYSTSDIADHINPAGVANSFAHPYPGTSNGNWPGYAREGANNYEQPFPHIHQCSTISSGASGTYNHLHEHYPSGSHHHLACGSQSPQQFTPHPHHYETMDLPLCQNCPQTYGVQVQIDGNGDPQAVQYRHHAGDARAQNPCFTAPMRRTRPNDPTMAGYPCCGAATECRQCTGSVDHLHREGYRGPTSATMAPAIADPRYNPNQQFDSLESDNSFSARRSQIKMGTSGLRGNLPAPQRRQRPGNYNKNGRSSDPLSTDQGYDTDSQQHGGGAQSDSDSRVNAPKPTLIVRSVDNSGHVGGRLRSVVESTTSEENTLPPRRIDTNRLTNRNRASLSDLSDIENDLEVERITKQADDSTNPSPVVHEDSGNYDDSDDVNSPLRHKNEEEMIDTECGGRVSVAESVTSWCAHPGSTPRCAGSYGKHVNKNKKTSDPNVILANARKQQVENMRQRGEEINENGRLSTENGTRQNKKYTYTLPGTAATGTKAKIDLKNGGISMMTNL